MPTLFQHLDCPNEGRFVLSHVWGACMVAVVKAVHSKQCVYVRAGEMPARSRSMHSTRWVMRAVQGDEIKHHALIVWPNIRSKRLHYSLWPRSCNALQRGVLEAWHWGRGCRPCSSPQKDGPSGGPLRCTTGASESCGKCRHVTFSVIAEAPGC